jgi:hypothetical protein
MGTQIHVHGKTNSLELKDLGCRTAILNGFAQEHKLTESRAKTPSDAAICTDRRARGMPRQWFNTFWSGGELPPLQWACMDSFQKKGHDLRLFSFENIRVPEGVNLEDASEISAKEDLFLFEGSPSAFSDLFRYELILRTGEWWVDTDVYCLSNDIPDCQYAWAYEDDRNINGAILKFPARDQLLQSVQREALRTNSGISYWCELGPELLSKYLRAMTPPNHFGTRQSFYPVHWLAAFLFWLPSATELIHKAIERSCFLHFWASMFPRFEIDVRTPPYGSFLHEIYQYHSVTNHNGFISGTQFRHTLDSIHKYLEYEIPNVGDRGIVLPENLDSLLDAGWND